MSLSLSPGMATPTPESSPKRVGYEVLKESHRKAYAYLTEALRIDESGVGEEEVMVCLSLTLGHIWFDCLPQ